MGNMKVLSFLLLTGALMVIGIQAQTPAPEKSQAAAPPIRSQAPILILDYHWTRSHRSQGSASDADQKARDAAIRQRIAFEQRDAAQFDQNAALTTQKLEESRKNQVGQIPVPQGVLKGYEYKAQVRNLSDKNIKLVQWSYVFTTTLTQKEGARHQFYSRARIRPGQEKKLSTFTRDSPPSVINVKELGKNGNRPWDEGVVIDRGRIRGRLGLEASY